MCVGGWGGGAAHRIKRRENNPSTTDLTLLRASWCPCFPNVPGSSLLLSRPSCVRELWSPYDHTVNAGLKCRGHSRRALGPERPGALCGQRAPERAPWICKQSSAGPVGTAHSLRPPPRPSPARTSTDETKSEYQNVGLSPGPTRALAPSHTCHWFQGSHPQGTPAARPSRESLEPSSPLSAAVFGQLQVRALSPRAGGQSSVCGSKGQGSKLVMSWSRDVRAEVGPDKRQEGGQEKPPVGGRTAQLPARPEEKEVNSLR